MKGLSFSRTILHGNRYYASASHISASIYTKYALSFVKNSRRAFRTRRREERRSLERVVGSNRGYSSSKTRNFRERIYERERERKFRMEMVWRIETGRRKSGSPASNFAPFVFIYTALFT